MRMVEERTMSCRRAIGTVPETKWLTPDCNDYRCAGYGQCVFDRQECLDYLAKLDTLKREAADG